MNDAGLHSTARLLDALESFRDLDARISMNSVVAFLRLCESEGVSMKELAFQCRMTEATASRSVRMLEAADAATALSPALGLIELSQNPYDARSRLIFLTEDGRRLRAALVNRMQECK